MMTRIEAELAADVDRARKFLTEKFGRITVEGRVGIPAPNAAGLDADHP